VLKIKKPILNNNLLRFKSALVMNFSLVDFTLFFIKNTQTIYRQVFAEALNVGG